MVTIKRGMTICGLVAMTALSGCAPYGNKIEMIVPVDQSLSSEHVIAYRGKFDCPDCMDIVVYKTDGKTIKYVDDWAGKKFAYAEVTSDTVTTRIYSGMPGGRLAEGQYLHYKDKIETNLRINWKTKDEEYNKLLQ